MSAGLPDWLRRGLFLPPEATETARHVDALHAVVIGTSFAGIGVLALVTFYYLARYRRRAPLGPTPQLVASARRELVLVGSLATLFVSFWVVGYAQYRTIETPPPDSMVVYVTAKQWMWKFTYPDGKSSINVLAVPANRPVQLVMTSRDVIHSFYVPAFRIKQDVVPGRYVSAWIDSAAAGTYPIRCAELCGLSHSQMVGEVRVLDANEFDAFLEDGAPAESPEASLAARGEKVAAEKGCFACHTVDGQPHIGPTWQGLFGSKVRLKDGGEVVADPAYLTRSMMDPGSEVVDGFDDVMPTYQGQLEAIDAASLVEYMRALSVRGPSPAVALPRASASAEPSRPRGPSEGSAAP